MATLTSTFFYDNAEGHVVVNKELTPYLVVDTIYEFINNQHQYIYGSKPHCIRLQNMYVNGFMLFNLYKNKSMLDSKDNLLQYLKNNQISMEEKNYFTDIALQIQRPKFLTQDEVEYIRDCGNLDGYDDDDEYEYEIECNEFQNIGRAIENLEKRVLTLAEKFSKIQ